MDRKMGTHSRRRWLLLVGVVGVMVLVAAAVLWWSRDTSGYQSVDLRELTDIPLDPITGHLEDLPAECRRLDGQRIRLVGEMCVLSSEALTGSSFDLAPAFPRRSEWQRPAAQQFVHATMTTGGAVTFSTGLVEARGTLHIQLKRVDGRLASVYQMDVDQLVAVPPAPDRYGAGWLWGHRRRDRDRHGLPAYTLCTPLATFPADLLRTVPRLRL